MIKRTQKYNRALELFPDYPHSSASELYQHLSQENYYWDSSCQSWVFSPASQQNPLSVVVRVRVWADKNRVEEIADRIEELLGEDGRRCLEKSQVYPCRPPQANDARVYLTFE